MSQIVDLSAVIRDAEDRLFPAKILDAWERSLYYHLLRRTHVERASTALVAIDPLAKATGMSTTKVREILRSLHEKGCVSIDDRSRSGHSVRVLLPHEVLGPPVDSRPNALDVESIDFFIGRKYVHDVLSREGGCCFYCLREIPAESCTLDHVIPQVAGTDNSFRNIVASCHSCNTTKQQMPADEFLRLLYRRGMLSAEDLPDRLLAVEHLRAGLLRPTITAPAV